MIELSALRRRLLREAAWVFAGQLSSAVGTMVGLRWLTEWVPPSVYGSVALANGVIALAQGLTVGPMMQAVLRFYPEYAAAGAVRALRWQVAASLYKPTLAVAAGLCVVVSAWSARIGEGALLGALCAALFLLEVLRTVAVAFLNAAREQRAMALLVGADAWARPLTAVAMVWLLGANAAAVLWGYDIGAALVLLFLHLCRRRRGQLGFPKRPNELSGPIGNRQLWRYAAPLIPLPLCGWVHGQSDRYLLGVWTGLEAAGLYAALYGLASRPFIMFAAGVELALRQPYYEKVSAGDRRGEWRLFWSWLTVVLGGSLVLLLLFLIFHRQLAALLLAADYRAQSSLMVWIAAGYTFSACTQVVERICYAWHDTRGVLLIQATGAVFSLAVAAPMVSSFGLPGAAWAAPIYFGIQLIVATVRARVARLNGQLAIRRAVARPEAEVAHG